MRTEMCTWLGFRKVTCHNLPTVMLEKKTFLCPCLNPLGLTSGHIARLELKTMQAVPRLRSLVLWDPLPVRLMAYHQSS
eukprot:19929_4